ncbi:Uncharacterised protein [BD1-7 clade bacterium]|uniref:Mu-like prophage protein Com n=1 Tax=BD1-7 clade bacterium TaxID=2029982 RepID=A0A5S9QTD7_9GAMM|nr:Uncharacterised protein [BD1-7 clade bacterium]CAA0122798.1 Uncharacterised protein [BD1-7 clade bacterium]
MEAVRCTNCDKLLFKAAATGTIEIKCPRCKRLQTIKSKNTQSVTNRNLYDGETRDTLGRR